uniref:TFIIS-type domain-containing protein n=1 Tax=Pavo cristatus TaxID=9049 RepID=A0A8C9LCW6_PAVCR
MTTEDEIIRIAKKMDKMVQKKNAVSRGGARRGPRPAPRCLLFSGPRSAHGGCRPFSLFFFEFSSLLKSLVSSSKKQKTFNIRLVFFCFYFSFSSSSSNSSSRKEEGSAPSNSFIPSFPRAPSTSDSVRVKCREMLSAALRTGGDLMPISTYKVIFWFYGLMHEIKKKLCFYYSSKCTHVRMRRRKTHIVSNLSQAEMASDELKEMRKNLTKEAIREHQMAKTGGTQTDLFTCGKCKKKNCTYTQVQTRSADEPMTTFVVCNECGNRWKLIFC